MNGYAYPWIDEQILSETCMYLTSISIFSYGFTEAGELVPPAGHGEEDILREASVRPLSRFWSLHRWEQTAGLITIWWRFLYGIWKFSKS